MLQGVRSEAKALANDIQLQDNAFLMMTMASLAAVMVMLDGDVRDCGEDDDADVDAGDRGDETRCFQPLGCRAGR